MESNVIAELQKARENIKLFLEVTADWRKEAREDYAFYQGDQYAKEDREALRRAKKPIITINRCRPIVNLLCGYASLNAYEPEFLPRGPGDNDICRAAKGITKYVYDQCNFKREKKKVFRDKLICGRGFYWVYYDFDYDKLEGVIKIERKSPFSVFIDPESEREDLSDAQYCGLFSWKSPEELAAIFPEFREQIMAIPHQYDESEKTVPETVAGEPLWYSKQFKKLRVVQYWYKVHGSKTVYEYAPGKIVGEDELQQNPALATQVQMMGIQPFKLPTCDIKMMTFVDNIILEAKPSPYLHKRFPLVQEVAFYTGEKDDANTALEPAGIIRDIKDVQREINKQRSQRMAILNTQANGVWVLQGNVTADVRRQVQEVIAKGGKIELPPGVTLDRLPPDGVASGNIEIERASADDIYNITGINPELLGVDVPASTSGRAIELKQKQAVTQIADLFDEQQHAERQILDRLWGERGRPGLIPQYFTEEKVIRIIGNNGQHEFVNIKSGLGQPMVAQPIIDPMTGQPVIDPKTGQIAQKILYDLSQFEFDIVISESPATPTARLSNLYQLQDAIKAGVPAEAVLDILIDMMDFPGKEEAKQRVVAYMQAQMQGIQQQQSMPGVPPERIQQPPNPNTVPPM